MLGSSTSLPSSRAAASDVPVAAGHARVFHQLAFEQRRRIGRAGRRRLAGELVGQFAEQRVVGHGSGLAKHFHESAGALGGVHIGTDAAFAGGSAGLLLGRRRPALAEQFHRGLFVAARFGQRLLAIHHRKPAALPKLPDHFCRDFRHRFRDSFSRCHRIIGPAADPA